MQPHHRFVADPPRILKDHIARRSLKDIEHWGTPDVFSNSYLRTHHPEVAGSNPVVAIRKGSWKRGFLSFVRRDPAYELLPCEGVVVMFQLAPGTVQRLK